MAARLSRLLTASTVILLAALLVLMIADQLTAANLSQWINAVMWAAAVLILIRLLTRVGSWRSNIAVPVAGTGAVQSRLFGFTPGSSPIEDSSGPAYTTSAVEDGADLRRTRAESD